MQYSGLFPLSVSHTLAAESVEWRDHFQLEMPEKSASLQTQPDFKNGNSKISILSRGCWRKTLVAWCCHSTQVCTWFEAHISSQSKRDKWQNRSLLDLITTIANKAGNRRFYIQNERHISPYLRRESQTTINRWLVNNGRRHTSTLPGTCEVRCVWSSKVNPT